MLLLILLLLYKGNLLGTIGIIIGYQPDPYVCTFQAIITDIGFLYSAAWTLVNTYQLWLVADSLTIISDKGMRTLHIIIWTFPIIFSFLPYAWSQVILFK